MALTAQEKLQLRKLVKELKSYKAPHTEFVSVYIPEGYEITKIINHLAEEQGTASNIKSASTRKNVQAALERMIQHLRNFKQTPPHGLAVFSGNVAAMEGKQDLKVWSIEPPIPLNIRIYRCDKNFVTDILENMMMEHRVYGLVVLDRRDANLALLKGKSIIPLQRTHSEVPGKFKAGGQCLLSSTIIIRKGKKASISKVKVGDLVLSYDFKKKKLINSRVTDKWKVKKEILLEVFAKKKIISCSEDHLFFIHKKNKIERVPAKKLRKGDLLFLVNKQINPILITKIKRKRGKWNLVDVSVKNQNFIANGIIVHNSAQRFARIREGAIKDHFKKIAEYMKEQFLPYGNNLQGIILGGPGVTVQDFLNKDYLTGDVKKRIIGTKDLSYTGDFGLQELLDKSEDLLAEEEVALEKKAVNRFLEQFMHNPKKAAYGEKEVEKALEMNAVDVLLVSEAIPEDKILELEEKARKGGSEVKIISVETREGAQLRDLGGIAATLRFEIE